jgi:hypothetical protein
MGEANMYFPSLQAANLNGTKLNLPGDLGGRYNLLLVAFHQWHQASVDTWLPLAEQLEADLPGFMYYELPTIRELNIFARGFINAGMRAGIPNPDTRGRTITLYLDKQSFCRSLGIQDESHIHLFLVDPQGKVMWRGEGEYAMATADSLLRTLNKLLSQFDPVSNEPAGMV